MKKTLYTPLLTAALLLAASCANDPVEEVLNPSAPGTHLPGDTFIIDYAASTGEADTRADANQRIQSLDYLVYQSTDGGTTYTLLKRRAIPDINTGTQWPLTRETMTWAQREALKDTLNTSCMYKMVFVANAADWIWDNTETDRLKGSSTIVLQHANLPTDETEAPTFDEGRLILPPRVFKENDMYYMETVEVDGKNYTGEKTAHQNVLLKRMINKVEIMLEKKVTDALKDKDDAGVESYVKEQLEKYYKNHYISNIEDNEGNTLGTLESTVQKYITEITDKIDKEIEEIYGRPNQKNSKTKFSTLLKQEGRETIVNNINECNDANDISNCVKHLFIQTMKDEWIKYCNWKDVIQINVNYEINSFPYAIDFNKKTIINTTDNINTTIEAQKIIGEANNQYDNHYIFYIFSNNEDSNEESKLNVIENLEFITKDGSYFNTTCNVIPGNKSLEGNKHYYLICKPITEIQISNSKTFTFEKENYDLDELMNWDLDDTDKWDYLGMTWTIEKMYQWVNSLFHQGIDEEDQNGTDFTPYTLKLSIPSIDINNAWENMEVTN